MDSVRAPPGESVIGGPPPPPTLFTPGFGGAAVPSPSVRLLVVEDEVDLAEALAQGLRQQGYAVDVAYDGADRPVAPGGEPLRPRLPRPEPARPSTVARCAGGCAPIRPMRPTPASRRPGC